MPNILVELCCECVSNAFRDQPLCTAERLGERFVSGSGVEFVWNGCGGCRGDECKWRDMEHAISCAWWHAWDDLSVEQRLAAETLGYHQARDWVLEELAGATRWGSGECECMLGSECRFICTRPECAQQPECICWRARLIVILNFSHIYVHTCTNRIIAYLVHPGLSGLGSILVLR